MSGDFFQWRTISGELMRIGDKRITLQSQFLAVRLPFGGFVWNRPALVLVEQHGLVEEIPIVDVTRLAVLALAGLSTAVTVLTWFKRK